MSSKPFLNIHNVSLAYDNKSVVENIDLTMSKGEIACLIGPSGCGKTSLLRAISGFTQLDKGSISLDNSLLSDTSFTLPPEKRGIGMVFQDHALFPHLSVEKNIQFGLHKLNKKQKHERLNDLIHMMGLSGYNKKYPHQLSGGQSQRVALARAIAPQPALLLMDEPFSNLDKELSIKLGQEIHNLLKQLNMTAIMVTHDQDDAFAIGDKVGVIHHGKLLQWDTPFNLYHLPNSRLVANFIGEGVFIAGEKINQHTIQTACGYMTGKTVNISSDFPQDNPHQQSKAVDVLIRPDDVSIVKKSSLHGVIQRKVFKGAETLYTITINQDIALLCLAPSHKDYSIGEQVAIKIDSEHLVYFPSKTC